MCSFQTAAKHGENAPNTIARWNHAILDGIGYTDLIQENNERQERARREKAGNFVTTHLS